MQDYNKLLDAVLDGVVARINKRCDGELAAAKRAIHFAARSAGQRRRRERERANHPQQRFEW